MTFRCGHPREGNTYATPGGIEKCALCQRIHSIAHRAKRDQERLNAGTFYTLGERIVRGIA